MSDRCFVDANVLVYAFDNGVAVKRRRAIELINGDDELVLSTQVLQEFYVTVVRKLSQPLTEADAELAVRDLATLPVIHVDTGMVLAAIATSRVAKLSLWDALILQAAVAGDCERIYSEDLQHGFRFQGLEVVNPFA